MRLRDKIVMITDADSASGRAIMLRLSGEGAHFLLVSDSAGQAIDRELAALRKAGSKAVVTRANLQSRPEVAAMLRQAAEQLGPVDALIHNADRFKPIDVEHGEPEVFLELLHTNAKTAFVCAQTVGRQMADRQTGTIVFINSIHAEKPTGTSFAYSAAKGAVQNLAREAALVLGRNGVRVNTILMGPVEGDEERFGGGFSDLYDDYLRKLPSLALGDYGDLADAVLFLCSDEARYINGADLRLDGGFLLHYLDSKKKAVPAARSRRNGRGQEPPS